MNCTVGVIERSYVITIKEQLIHELNRLNSINQKVQQELLKAPEGSLRLGKSQGCVQYFRCTEADGKVYIPKNDISLVKKLAQKSYNNKILRYTEKVSRQLEGLLKIYDDDKIEQIYQLEHAERQKLIIPVEPTKKQKLDEWISEPYEGKGFLVDSQVIMSNNGVRVRSKSEKILADYFESKGIKYKYECPIRLKPYGTIYPDFTFLSNKTGGEIYWEHEGMMDNPDYAKSAIKKIELYENNGIFPGENLILTFESSASVVNMNVVKELTDRYLL